MSEQIYVYQGNRYRTVERKAEVGEKILVSNVPKDWETFNRVFTVEAFDRDGDVMFEETKYLFTRTGDYVVLEPLESEEVTVDQSQASPAVIEMFTALSRKIVSLERQLVDTQRNVERQAEELENAKHRISKHATMFGAVEEKVEMLTERTNYRALAKEMARRLSR